MKTMTQIKDTHGKTENMIVKRVSVPIGLEELMEGLSKEVILKKPKDLYLFASEYFTRLVNLREKSNKYKAHPVHTIQSLTQVKNMNVPLSKKISPTRPIKHLSRQLSVRSKSPVLKRPIQSDFTAKRSVASKSRDRKISTDRKDSEAKGGLKTILSKDLSKSINSQGTSTATSSLQSTPREKRQSSVTRKIKSSVIDDQNKREENNRSKKVQKRSKSEQVKTDLITPTVVGATKVVSNAAAVVVDMDIIRKREKGLVTPSDILAGDTAKSSNIDTTNTTDLKQNEHEQFRKDDYNKMEFNIQSNDSSKISLENSLDSDILAKTTNVAEIAKTINPSEENSKSLEKPKTPSLSDNANETVKLNTAGSNDEKLRREEIALNEKGKHTPIIQEAELTTRNFESTNSSSNIEDHKPVQLAVENDLRLNETDQKSSNNVQDIDKHFKHMERSFKEKSYIEFSDYDGKLNAEKDNNILDSRNTPGSAVNLDSKDEDLKLAKGTDDVDKGVTKEQPVENLKEISENATTEVNEFVINTITPVLEQKQDTEEIAEKIKNISEDDKKIDGRVIQMITEKVTQNQNGILDVDNDKATPVSNENKLKLPEIAKNVDKKHNYHILETNNGVQNNVNDKSDAKRLDEIKNKTDPVTSISEKQGTVSDNDKLELHSNLDIATHSSDKSENKSAIILKTEGSDEEKQNELEHHISATAEPIKVEEERKEAAIEKAVSKNDQVKSTDVTHSRSTEKIKDYMVTIKTEKGKSDDILIVSISDQQNLDKSNSNTEDNKTHESLENIHMPSSTNDKKEDQNQFFRENEKLVSQEDDKTKMNIENSNRNLYEEKIYESNENNLDGDVNKKDVPHNDVSTPSEKIDTVQSKINMAQLKNTTEIESKSYDENKNWDESPMRKDITKKIVNYEISKNQPGLIDSPVKHFLNTFINSEKSNIAHSTDPFNSEKNVKIEIKDHENVLAENYTNEENNTTHALEEKQITKGASPENNESLKGILPTDDEKHNLTFNSVKDLLSYDYNNVNNLENNKINKLQDVKNSQLEHEKSSTLQNHFNQKSAVNKGDETFSVRVKRSNTKEETMQESENKDSFENKHSNTETDSNIQHKKYSTITSKKFDSSDHKINHSKENDEESGNINISDTTNAQTGNFESIPDIKISENDTSSFNCVEKAEVKVDRYNNQDTESSVNVENISVTPEKQTYTDKKVESVDEFNLLRAETLSKTETTVDNAHVTKGSDHETSALELTENLSEPDVKTEMGNHNNFDIKDAKTSKDNSADIDGFRAETKLSSNNIGTTLKETENKEVVIRRINENSNINTAEEKAKISDLNKIKTNVEITKAKRKDSEKVNELGSTERSQVTSDVNIIQNIVKSKISVHKPGVLDSSVRQYLNSFLTSEQVNVFQAQLNNQSKSAYHENTKSGGEIPLDNHKELLLDVNPKENNTESGSTKIQIDKQFLKKKGRSHSEENVFSNETKLTESITKNAKMRRVKSVGPTKQDENEYKSKIPLSAKRSAGRRPLVRQQEKDSKDIEEKLTMKKGLSKVTQGIRPRSGEDDSNTTLLKSTKNSDKTEEYSKEQDTYKTTDDYKFKKEDKELFAEAKKFKNEETSKEDGVTKEDVIIAKTILKGIKGAEKHIDLIEDEIISDSKSNLPPETESENENNMEMQGKYSKITGEEKDILDIDNHKELHETQSEKMRYDSKSSKGNKGSSLENVAEEKTLTKEVIKGDDNNKVVGKDVVSVSANNDSILDMYTDAAAQKIKENQQANFAKQENPLGNVAGMNAEKEKGTLGDIHINEATNDLITTYIKEERNSTEVTIPNETASVNKDSTHSDHMTSLKAAEEKGILRETDTKKETNDLMSTHLDEKLDDTKITLPVETISVNNDSTHSDDMASIKILEEKSTLRDKDTKTATNDPMSKHFNEKLDDTNNSKITLPAETASVKNDYTLSDDMSNMKVVEEKGILRETDTKKATDDLMSTQLDQRLNDTSDSKITLPAETASVNNDSTHSDDMESIKEEKGTLRDTDTKNATDDLMSTPLDQQLDDTSDSKITLPAETASVNNDLTLSDDMSNMKVVEDKGILKDIDTNKSTDDLRCTDFDEKLDDTSDSKITLPATSVNNDSTHSDDMASIKEEKGTLRDMDTKKATDDLVSTLLDEKLDTTSDSKITLPADIASVNNDSTHSDDMASIKEEKGTLRDMDTKKATDDLVSTLLDEKLDTTSDSKITLPAETASVNNDSTHSDDMASIKEEKGTLRGMDSKKATDDLVSTLLDEKLDTTSDSKITLPAETASVNNDSTHSDDMASIKEEKGTLRDMDTKKATNDLVSTLLDEKLDTTSDSKITLPAEIASVNNDSTLSDDMASMKSVEEKGILRETDTKKRTDDLTSTYLDEKIDSSDSKITLPAETASVNNDLILRDDISNMKDVEEKGILRETDTKKATDDLRSTHLDDTSDSKLTLPAVIASVDDDSTLSDDMASTKFVEEKGILRETNTKKRTDDLTSTYLDEKLDSSDSKITLPAETASVNNDLILRDDISNMKDAEEKDILRETDTKNATDDLRSTHLDDTSDSKLTLPAVIASVNNDSALSDDMASTKFVEEKGILRETNTKKRTDDLTSTHLDEKLDSSDSKITLPAETASVNNDLILRDDISNMKDVEEKGILRETDTKKATDDLRSTHLDDTTDSKLTLPAVIASVDDDSTLSDDMASTKFVEEKGILRETDTKNATGDFISTHLNGKLDDTSDPKITIPDETASGSNDSKQADLIRVVVTEKKVHAEVTQKLKNPDQPGQHSVIENVAKEKADAAATTIQKTWKGFHVRNNVEQKNKIVVADEAVKKGEVLDQMLKEEENAAARIQSLWRGYITRKNMENSRNKSGRLKRNQEEAIIKIQAAVRGYLERIAYKKLKYKNTANINNKPNSIQSKINYKKISYDEKAAEKKVVDSKLSASSIKNTNKESLDQKKNENVNLQENTTNTTSNEKTKFDKTDQENINYQNDNSSSERSYNEDINNTNFKNVMPSADDYNLESLIIQTKNKEQKEFHGYSSESKNISEGNFHINNEKTPSTEKVDKNVEDESDNEILRKSLTKNLSESSLKDLDNSLKVKSAEDQESSSDFKNDNMDQKSVKHNNDNIILSRNMPNDNIKEGFVKNLSEKQTEKVRDQNDDNGLKKGFSENAIRVKTDDQENLDEGNNLSNSTSENQGSNDQKLEKNAGTNMKNFENGNEVGFNSSKSKSIKDETKYIRNIRNTESQENTNDNKDIFNDVNKSTGGAVTHENEGSPKWKIKKPEKNPSNIETERSFNLIGNNSVNIEYDNKKKETLKGQVNQENISDAKTELNAESDENHKRASENTFINEEFKRDELAEKIGSGRDDSRQMSTKDEAKEVSHINNTESEENIKDGKRIFNDVNKSIEGAVTHINENEISPKRKIEKQLEKIPLNIESENSLNLVGNNSNNIENNKIIESLKDKKSHENISNGKTESKATENILMKFKGDEGLSNNNIHETIKFKDKSESVLLSSSSIDHKTEGYAYNQNKGNNNRKLNNVQDNSNENNNLRNDPEMENKTINNEIKQNNLSDLEKPEFYRSDTVLEPNVVKKAILHLGDDTAPVETQHMNGDTVLSEKDDNNNNNTQHKDETELEIEVRSAVDKILKSNNKSVSPLETEIETAVKNIMENNIDYSKFTPLDKSSDESKIEGSTKNKGNMINEERARQLSQVKLQQMPVNLDENINNTDPLNKIANNTDKNDEHVTKQYSISRRPSTEDKDQPVYELKETKNNVMLSKRSNDEKELENDIWLKNLKKVEDASTSEINTDDVSSVDSVDSVITVVPNVNYGTSIKKENSSSEYSEHRNLSSKSLSQDISKGNDNKDISTKSLVQKSLSTNALEGHVELIGQVQNKLLDQICGKPVDTASKFDIEQLRKELHEAASLYEGEDEDMRFVTHDDELLEYLNDFEPESDNSYESKIIRTPVRELPDIEEEVDSSDTETTRRAALESSTDKESDFCKTPVTTGSQKLIDNKPLSDHIEILNLDKFKQGHNEIVINNDNIQINGTESDGPGKDVNDVSNQTLLHTSELHDSVIIPISSSSAKRSTLVHSGKLKHTSEFHDTLVVPLPSGSDVNIKNEATEMLAKDKPIEPTRTETVDTGNQTTIQQSPAGAPTVTSRRSSLDGVDVVEAQASLRDTSPAKPKSVESFTDQSLLQSPRFVEQDMESENNNKKNNAIDNISSPGKNMEAEAATKIQAGFRGYQVRKQLKNKNTATDKGNQDRKQLRRKSSGRKSKNPDLAEKSAVKIQAGVRGFLVRRRQKKQLNSSASA